MIQDPHAESKKLYAQDALETDKPWERWELRLLDEDEWYVMSDHPRWVFGCEYRRKTTLNINGHEVPMPLYARPEGVDRVFVVSPNQPDGYTFAAVVHILECNWRLGIYHTTAEAAVLHAKAILSFTAKGKP